VEESEEVEPSLKSPVVEPLAVVSRPAAAVALKPVAATGRSPSTSLLRRLLKYALPLPLLLILLFGSLYLLFGDCFAKFDRYGLVINPRLQHVRGAPPV
jgi:hypothetical protein